MCVNMLNICQGCQLLYTIIHIVAQRYCPPASALLDSMFDEVVNQATRTLKNLSKPRALFQLRILDAMHLGAFTEDRWANNR